ncbi:hypothetical protein BDQ12DRAFT_698896 [Crucibulum laeve]|uniref:BHLH domain-containing protein n=1 Tax=Crucibulum laeve TaxID=68775 RepID=A0A5C3M0Y4_9AGAR|nr:hypothetical protein BDQ12DRAFT_698896 [Crucibulum laeve]
MNPLFPFNSSSPNGSMMGMSTSPSAQLTMNMLGNLMQMQELGGSSQGQGQGQGQGAQGGGGGAYNPQLLLEQQFKLTQLQQLQQLQNQIFQQQVRKREQQQQQSFSGLPTPGEYDHISHYCPSTEIRPTQPPMEFVSPMNLMPSYMESQQQQQQHQHQQSSSSNHNQQQQHQNPYRTPSDPFTSPMLDGSHTPSHHSSHSQHLQHLNHGGNIHYDHTRSAPENIAFRTSAPDLDLDISPLTSPWLGAHGATRERERGSYSGGSNNGSNNGGNTSVNVGSKRVASSSGDEAPSRKKLQSPAIRASNPTLNHQKSYRGSKSTTSTPLLRGTRTRGGSVAGMVTVNASSNSSSNGMNMNMNMMGMNMDVVHDTPSPVDLSMPPPAAPGMLHSNSGSTSHSSASHSGSSGMHTMMTSSGMNGMMMSPAMNLSAPAMSLTSSQMNPHLMPVTPASIMNLGRLGINSGLSRVGAGKEREQGDAESMKEKEKERAEKEAAKEKKKPKITTDVKTRAGKKSAGVGTSAGPSPSLKAILPGPTPLSPALTPSLPGPVMAVRKTSHKAAEQKRRDSLKSTFDDLRGLLPPIPLPGDDVEVPILPGALPPRGPPKAGGEGPNKGVSKLQLLICGNDYIRTLKGRVERRDEEIAKLRREVGRLRVVVERQKEKGMEGVAEDEETDGNEEAKEGDEEEIELEKDLDAVEALRPALGRVGMGEGDDGDEEGDE